MKRRKAPARSRNVKRLVLGIDENMPRDLVLAVKAEARSQGLTLRAATVQMFRDFLLSSSRWRAFLAQEADRPEARQRGRIPTHLQKS